jgi:glutamate mutase epsilon subunit
MQVTQSMMEAAVISAFEKLQGQLDFALPFQTPLDMDETITANQYVSKLILFLI